MEPFQAHRGFEFSRLDLYLRPKPRIHVSVIQQGIVSCAAAIDVARTKIRHDTIIKTIKNRAFDDWPHPAQQERVVGRAMFIHIKAPIYLRITMNVHQEVGISGTHHQPVLSERNRWQAPRAFRVDLAIHFPFALYEFDLLIQRVQPLSCTSLVGLSGCPLSLQRLYLLLQFFDLPLKLTYYLSIIGCLRSHERRTEMGSRDQHDPRRFPNVHSLSFVVSKQLNV